MKTTFFAFIISILVGGQAVSQGDKERGPVYECENAQGEKLYIFFDRLGTIVKRTGADQKNLREWKLSNRLSFDDKPRDPLECLFPSVEKNKPVDLKNTFEVREQFFRDVNPQELQMMLIQEGDVLVGWKCFYRGTARVVRMLEKYAESGRADFFLVRRAVKGFLTEDRLTEESLGMLVQLVERYGLWSKKVEKTELRQLIVDVFEPIVHLSASMAKQVEGRLSEVGRATWKLILEDESFDSFAPIQRWIFWVNLAERENNEAVRAGVRGFVKSPLFQDKTMQKFFQTETKGGLKALSKERFKQIVSSGLDEAEKKFLEKLWNEREKAA